jgi:hypothetical protein
MLWRNDGINITYVFSGSAEGTDDAVAEMHRAGNQLVEDELLPQRPRAR